MTRILTFIFLLFISLNLAAQTGEIQGRITDEDNGEGVPFANVTLTINGALTGAQTDFDGFYTIKPVPPGNYEINISYVGYQTSITQGVLVTADKITFLNIGLATKSELLEEIVVKEYKVPLIKQDETSTGATVTKEDIENLPTRNVTSIVSTSAGVYQSDEGEAVNVKGSRSEATDYYIDGVKVRGSSALPTSAIEQVNVVTGGVPAKYGDATGGIINITTRGPSPKFSGGIELESSQITDPYNYNLLGVNLGGPLITINKGEKNQRPLLGFHITGQYTHQQDPDPSAIGVWHLSEAKQAEIEASPLTPLALGGFDRSSQYITMDDLELNKAKKNIPRQDLGATARLDFSPTRNINFRVGGNYTNSLERRYIESYQLMNRQGNDLQTRNVYRGYARFTQRFGTVLDASEDDEPNIFQNAFYSVQFDYTKSTDEDQSEVHKNNLWNYGHVGSFETFRGPSWGILEEGDVADDFAFPELLGRNYIYNQAVSDTLVNFTPGESNPLLAQHTSQYFDLAGSNSAFYNNINTIELNRGIINGTRSASLQSAHNLWYNPGRIVNNYGISDNDQYRLTFNGSVDIKKPGSSDRNKHALEFGVEYEQRIDRDYDTNPVGFWAIGRQRINSHLAANPDNIQVIRNGEYIHNSQWGNLDFPINQNDTLWIPTEAIGSQTDFDKSVRALFGFGDSEFINLDALDPSQLDISLFSADELLDVGMVDYYGYDYLGNKNSGAVNFADFWTARNEKGQLSRPIDAFRPVYMAGYLQDKFAFRDLIFNVGVRVDRFDANQKVLKDKYSLYGIKSVSEATDFQHPASVGSEWAVYVNDPTNPTQVNYYRDGDDWYLNNGELITDFSLLNSPVPYLNIGNVDNPANYIKDENFDVNSSFEDYTPQITVMPRISFSFPISQDALFFAHYNVLAQRPQGRLIATPDDYFYLPESGFVNNANLKPERTIDYQLGYKQKLSRSSALSLSAFYRELKDMVQYTNVFNAYPEQYNTFDNVDFGTVKGLESTYDLRRTGNVRITATYTLQFADGTGSDDLSQLSLVDLNQPNLRSITPLNYDSRHNIVTSIDYRYADGKKYDGPKLFGADIFSNAGMNLTLRGRSGEPYTRQRDPTTDVIIGQAERTTLVGQINGSRLPWNFRADLKADKDFKLGGGDREDGSKKRESYLNVFLQVQNLFDQANIVNVYSYTGNPDDNGYLSSNAGIDRTNASTSPQSFYDLFSVRVNDYDNYSRPRTIRLGLGFNF